MKIFLVLMSILLIIGSMVLGSCGSTTTTSTSATSTETKTTTTTSVKPATSTSTAVTPTTSVSPTESPKYGGVLKMILPPQTSNAGGWPADYVAGGEAAIGQLIYDTFLRGDDKGNAIPWLATSYKLADDLLSITFTFRKDVKFHDGTPFNGEAAKWNLEQLLQAGKQPFWKSVDLVDDYSIRVNFTQWKNTLVSAFIDGGDSFMVSPTAYEEHGKDWVVSNPTGTGPFIFESFQKDVSFVCKRNPNYWKTDDQGRQLPYLDGVTIEYVADQMTQKALMQAGESDVLQIEPGKDSAAMKAAGLLLDPRVQTTFCLFPDTANPDSPFANQKVREAVEYAINREAIAKAFSYGYWEAPYQIPPPGDPLWNPDFAYARTYDPDKARQLLSEAGYPDGFTITLVYGAAGTMEQNICLVVQSDLAKVGITANLEFPDFGKFISTGSSYHDSLTFLPIVQFSNFNTTLGVVLDPSAMYPNHNWKRTDEFISLYNKSLTSKELDVALGRAITDYLSSEAQIIPVYGGGKHYVYQSFVKNAGWWTRSFDTYWNYESAWLDK
jgi:peptide/nickel transport system substrate-binding protein